MIDPTFDRVRAIPFVCVDVAAELRDADPMPYHSGMLRPARVEIVYSYDFLSSHWTYRATLIGPHVLRSGGPGHAVSVSYAQSSPERPQWLTAFARQNMPSAILPDLRQVSS